jgi:hypothetical protein
LLAPGVDPGTGWASKTAALLTRTSIPPISRATPSTRPRAESASATSAPKTACGPPLREESVYCAASRSAR